MALFVALPLLLLIALAIKLTSRGPVLYTQERVGLDRRTPGTDAGNHRRTRDLGGRPFTIYKFRTMWVDAERATGAVWATQNDPRITPVGRFLRQYRLDEIPQLLNVMRGEMNIVGPPARAPHHLRRAAGAHRRVSRCASGPSRGSPGWRRSTTTTTARWTTCGPRCATTWSTSGGGAWEKTSASCCRPSRSIFLRRGGW